MAEATEKAGWPYDGVTAQYFAQCFSHLRTSHQPISQDTFVRKTLPFPAAPKIEASAVFGSQSAKNRARWSVRWSLSLRGSVFEENMYPWLPVGCRNAAFFS